VLFIYKGFHGGGSWLACRRRSFIVWMRVCWKLGVKGSIMVLCRTSDSGGCGRRLPSWRHHYIVACTPHTDPVDGATPGETLDPVDGGARAMSETWLWLW
jgi:hypothetical protein